MAEYYNNPFEAINPQAFGAEGGIPGFVDPMRSGIAAQKMQMALPFIEMMKKSGMIDLQRKEAENAEFMSPEAKEARSSKLKWEAEDARGKIKANPKKIEAEIARYEADIKFASPKAEQELAKMKAEVDKIRGTQYQALLSDLADIGDQISKDKSTSPWQKSEEYAWHLGTLKQKYPGVQIPDSFNSWSPQTELNLKKARLATLYSVDNEFKRTEAAKRDETELQGRRISAGATVRAAEISAEASKANSERVYGSREDQNEERRANRIAKTATELLAMDTLTMVRGTEKQKQQAIQNAMKRALEIESKIEQSKPQSKLKDSDVPKGFASKQEVEAAGYTYNPDYDYKKLPDGRFVKSKKFK